MARRQRPLSSAEEQRLRYVAMSEDPLYPLLTAIYDLPHAEQVRLAQILALTGYFEPEYRVVRMQQVAELMESRQNAETARSAAVTERMEAQTRNNELLSQLSEQRQKHNLNRVDQETLKQVVEVIRLKESGEFFTLAATCQHVGIGYPYFSASRRRYRKLGLIQ